jgi:nicotinate dehydrogenase subunit B
VTLFRGWVELGQGTPTSVRQIAAEELGLAFEQVNAAQRDTNMSISAFTAGSQATKTSMSATNVRGAAAAARQVLLNMAATQLGIPASTLTVDKGVISGGGKTIKYSDLIAGKLFNTAFAGTGAAVTPTFVDPSTFKLIGTGVPREDIPAIVGGTYTYIHNVRVPGMLHGRVVRPRGQAALGKGATILSVDPSSIKHLDAQVVRKGNFLGVVAKQEFVAIQAASQLKVKWDDTPSLPSNGNLAAALRNPANAGASDAYAVVKGDVTSALAGAATKVSATYFSPYNGHVPIGPNAAIADVDVKNQTALIFSATQGPYSTRTLVTQAINQALGLNDNSTPANTPAANAFQQQNVRVQVFPGSGTYGHSALDDVTASAAIMSALVGKPVRVQFMRWDEHGWDQMGPAYLIDITAGLDASGKIVAYDYTSFQHGSMSTESASELAGVKLSTTEGTGTADTTSSASYYSLIPNRRVLSKRVGNYHGFLKGTYLRAPAARSRCSPLSR